MQKALTPQHPPENNRSATAGLPTTSICKGGSEEELQQLTESLEKTASGYGTEITSNKTKIVTNIIKPRSPTNIWMNGKTLEEVDQFHTNQRPSNAGNDRLFLISTQPQQG